MNQLVSVQELSKILNVPPSWIYQQTRLGSEAIPFVKIGKYVRFNPDEVINFFRRKGGLPEQKHEETKELKNDDRDVELENGLKGRLLLVGKESEAMDFFEVDVNGRKFFCTEEERRAFDDYLAGIPGEVVQLTFLHSMRFSLERLKQGRGQQVRFKRTPEGKKEEETYNCTIKAPKELARVIFSDMQERCERATEIIADGLFRKVLAGDAGDK